MEGFTMATLLTTIGTIVTEAVSWTGTIATMVIGQPLFLLPIAMGFIGLGIHWFNMLTR